ncbi:MAG: hypothetical protein IK145_07340 [Bacteroidales bacterium]|nr:hypothetical protein [Bacteroidales bacterium]
MEREDFEICISIAEQAKDLIIKMAGNLQNAMKIVRRNSDDEKELARVSLCIDDSDTVDTLHSLTWAVATLENGLDWVESISKKKN